MPRYNSKMGMACVTQIAEFYGHAIKPVCVKTPPPKKTTT
jgi:hypothetical protein